MAKQKLIWNISEDGERMEVTIKETNAVCHFLLTKLTGWKDFSKHLDDCPVAKDAFYAGMIKKLAQPTGGSGLAASKYPAAMEDLYKNIVETNSYAQRKSAEPKIAVSDVAKGILEMFDDGLIDEDTKEAMLSKVGQIRAGK